MRIVLTGDWHFGAQGKRIREDAEKIGVNWIAVRKAALRNLATKLEPGDVVLVAGDSFDGKKDIAQNFTKDMRSALDCISKKVGDTGLIIIIPGNHDYNCGDDWVWNAVGDLPNNVELIHGNVPQVIQVTADKNDFSIIAVPCVDQGDGEGLLEFLTQDWMDANGVAQRRLVLAHLSRARLTPAVKELGVPLLLGDEHSPSHDQDGGVTYEGCLVPTEPNEHGGRAGVFQWDNEGHLSRVSDIVMSKLAWTKVTIELPHEPPNDYNTICTESLPNWCESTNSIIELVVTGLNQDAIEHDKAIDALRKIWACVLPQDDTVPAPNVDGLLGLIEATVPDSFVYDAAQQLLDEFENKQCEDKWKAGRALQHLVRAVGRTQEQ